jgi:hypothetical protein
MKPDPVFAAIERFREARKAREFVYDHEPEHDDPAYPAWEGRRRRVTIAAIKAHR